MPVDIQTTHPTLPAIWHQAVADMEALRMADFAVRRSVFVPAAGIPWYVTLFGRDTLIVAMESISGFPEVAMGALDHVPTSDECANLAVFLASDESSFETGQNYHITGGGVMY